MAEPTRGDDHARYRKIWSHDKIPSNASQYYEHASISHNFGHLTSFEVCVHLLLVLWLRHISRLETLRQNRHPLRYRRSRVR